MKKILSVALALVMILSCVSIMAFATQSNGVIEISVVPTESSYNKGDVVTFEVVYEGSADAYTLGGPALIAFGYDSSVFETVEDLTANKDGSAQSTFIVDGYPISENYTAPMSSVRVFDPDGTNSVDAAKGWDKLLQIGIPTTQTWDCTNKTAMFAFKLKVRDDANPDGSYTVGISDEYYQREEIIIPSAEQGDLFGVDALDLYGLDYPTLIASVDTTVNVGTPATPSIIKPMSSQIRFRGVKTEADFAAVYDKLPEDEKTFDVRTRAVISPEDFLATFGTDEEAKKAITDFGFVFATEANVSPFDDAIAKKVAMGTATAEEGAKYVKQECHYMQHVDGGDYMFTCLVAGIKDAEHNQVLNALAYVCYNGEYIFMDTHATADYTTLYGIKPVA